jgi:site-specific DNA recombinase
MELMKARAVNKLFNINYLLTGLIYCGKCGAKMRYQKWGKKDCKIVCYSQDKSKNHLIRDPYCDNERIWASDLEDIVIKDIFSFSIKRTKFTEKTTRTLSTKDFLTRQYETAAAKIKKLYNLYASDGNEILLETIEELKESLAKISEQIKTENERAAISAANTEVNKKLETISETWEYMTKQEQKNIIRSVVDKIVVTDGGVEIFYKVNL